MPFLSRDWRGPGEAWVKSKDGWEMMKVVETMEGVKRRRQDSNSDTENKENREGHCIRLERHNSMPNLQPFSPITLKITKEVVGFNSLTEVLKRLDFCSAVHDVRRFHYVSDLLRLLLCPGKLYQLPGGSQKLVFRILEEMAGTVFSEHRNEHVLRALLESLQGCLENKAVWGSHLGGAGLVSGHTTVRRRIACITALESRRDEIERRRREEIQDDPVMDMNALPEECLREILCRLGQDRDVVSAGKATPTMGYIVEERRIWRELVEAHFTPNEIEFVRAKRPELYDNKKWRELYMAIKKQFGLRQQFTEMIMLCKPCRVLFWDSYGHPCYSSPSKSSQPIPITPTTFLTFFSI